MNLSGAYEDAKMELQISPLIDVVFLLLIYFIVSAKILQPEGDIPFQLQHKQKTIVLPKFFRSKLAYVSTRMIRWSSITG